MQLKQLFLILTFLSACGHSPNKENVVEQKISRNIQKDIDLLIPSGEIMVEIMDEVTMSPRRQVLQAKLMQAMRDNSEWFMEQQELVETAGGIISYDPRLGMTEPEWEEYKKYLNDMSDMQVVASDRMKVIITKSNGIISFKANGKLSHLNATTIDTQNNIVKMNSYKLIPLDTICVTSADNVFKSAWRGYKWQFSEPENVTMPTTPEEFANFSTKLYGLTLGLFEKTGKTYIEISGSEISEGMQTIRYKIPIVF